MVAIFVVLMFALFIGIDFFVLKAQGKKHPASSTYKVFDKKSFFFPENSYLAPGHTWLTKISGGLLKIGVDEFISKSLANFRLIPLVAEGAKVNKDDYLFEAQFNGSSVKFKSPITGIISSVNSDLANGEITDPYGKDWAVTVKPENLTSALSLTKTKEAAHKWLTNEFARLKDFLDANLNDLQVVGATMHDGGNIAEGALTLLNSDAIKKFESDFLN